MAVSSALYGLTLEKMMIDTAGQSLEAETHKVLVVNDSETPDFTVHDFRDDIVNEVTGTGWSAGGVALTSTEITLATGTLTFDAADVSQSTVTLTAAEAAVLYFNVGTAGTDQLVLMSDFGSPVSPSAGTFTIAWSASGIFTLDYTP